MDYLLDTHTFLWFINDDNRLSKNANNAIYCPNAIKYISIVSFWEIAIKLNLGKTKLEMPFYELIKFTLIDNFKILPVAFHHTFVVSTLENHHKDPFDRMLIAQAITENLVFITTDKKFRKVQKRSSIVVEQVIPTF